MNTVNQLLSAALLLTASSMTFAADSVGNAGAASRQSGQAAKHGALAAGQVVSATVAVPLVVVGEVGKAGGKAGEALAEFAVDQPLEVSDVTLTADPAPAAMMNANNPL